MKKIFNTLLICALSLMFLVSCSSGNKSNGTTSQQTNDQPYEQTNTMMDTVITLKAYGTNAKTAVDESFKRLDEIDKLASTTISTSDVYKINAAAGKEYVKVHPEIIKMIETSIKYSKLSGGAFDITTGPIINLWGIGTDKERLPSDSEIKAKLSLVGYNNISINKSDNSVMLQKTGMAIDLGGLAKGFAADEVLKIYDKYGIKKGLINLGSSTIYAIGTNQDGKPWSVGIKHPRDDDSSTYLGIIRISNQALSTSGDYERFFIKDGKRYHHIMNSSTGYPADTGVMSDTIVIDNNVPDKNMVADILTTTVFVMGPQKGIQFIDNLDGVSCEITGTDNKIYTSKGFKDKISNLGSDFKFAN